MLKSNDDDCLTIRPRARFRKVVSPTNCGPKYSSGAPGYTPIPRVVWA